MIRFFAGMFIILFIINCEKTNVTHEHKEVTKAVFTQDSIATLQSKFEKLKHYKETIVSSIQPGDTQHDDSLFHLFYRYVNDSVLPDINSFESDFIIKFGNYGGDTSTIDSTSKKIITILKENNFEVRYEGEGYAGIYTSPDYYISTFRNNLSDTLTCLLELKDHEDTQLYTSDAALLISFQQLGERVQMWDAFMVKYPHGTYGDFAKAKCNSYLVDFMIGQDNSPVFEDDTINQDILQVYKEYVSKYPGTYSAKIVSRYFDKIEINNRKWSDSFDSLVPVSDEVPDYPF